MDACRAAAGGEGIDLVALTDHNSIDGYRYLKPQFDTLARQAANQGLVMPVILPGVEFGVGGERPIHFLVIFSSDTCPEDIDKVIRHVFTPREPFDSRTGTLTPPVSLLPTSLIVCMSIAVQTPESVTCGLFCFRRTRMAAEE